MDIRKFFGPSSTTKQNESGKSKALDKNQNQKGAAKTKQDKKKSVVQKASVKKSSVEDDEEPVVIEDVSDDDDEFVIKNSQGARKSHSKKEPEAAKSKSLSTRSKERSRDKSSEASKLRGKEEKQSKQKLKSDSTDEEKPGKKLKDKQASKDLKKSEAESPLKREESNKKDRKTKEETTKGVRTSPRKQSSVVVKEEGKKRGKRKQISSDEESEEKIEVDDEDEEEVLVSRRKKLPKKANGKKAGRLLDSESDEEPVPKEKPKAKRKKKEAVVFVDESDEEAKKTALDKFVIHNATPKEKPQKKEEVKKGTPTNIADFFGGGSIKRSERTTSVKRKFEETKESEETEKKVFDSELHDDEDFLETLEQLDGPVVKKARDEKEESISPSKTAGGSLARKLAEKMKNGKEEEKKKVEAPSPSVSKSPVKKSPTKTESVKKGKVYTMEVSRKKPPTQVISPGKKKETVAETPPSKTPPKAKKVMEKDDDDGFGVKRASSFRAFKNRAGPLALGSKEIPEGEENSLEGLTFVITGILDSIERDDAKALIEKLGGKVTGSVSRKTSYVVVGREAGESKLAKVRDLKVKQLDEDQLFDLIRTTPGKTSKYELQAQEQAKKEASKKAEKEKHDDAKKKLEAFQSSRSPSKTASTPETKKPLFTQIKDSSETHLATSSKSTDLPPKSQKPVGSPESLMWVDKHKPKNLKQIIGQQGDKSNARKLLHWMKSWHQNIIVKGLKPSGNFFGGGDGSGCRAALLSGPPGIGKTTTATLVAQELGFSYVELNASDTRSKRSLKEVVAESLNNQTLVDYMGPQKETSPSGQSHCLIMDEVDGMAGNEDRGGLQELVQLIKGSKIPIICICNDRNSMKMRTLANYCLDLRFQRPRAEQIKGAVMSIAFKEGIKIPPSAVQEIIQASNHDIRQIIHNLSMWSAADKSLTFDQVKADAQKAHKDMKMGPFDVCRKVFVSDDQTRKMSLNDKSDLFFQDYSFGPLFVHENYAHIIPNRAKGDKSRHMSCLARTIDSISDGDLVDKLVRREGNWNLLPTQAMYASVIPGEIMRGSFPQMTAFPAWLGKFSSTGKTDRIMQELATHMRLEISCDKRGLNLDYLPALRARLTAPLTSKGSEGVPEVIETMDQYDIIKEDFDNIMEVTKWPNSYDPMAKLETKTKAAFTRQYNKEVHMTPYSTGVASKKRRGKGAGAMEEAELLVGEGEAAGDVVESEEEEDDTIEADTMIKTKKPAKGKGSAKAAPSAQGKGKGKGKR